MSQKKRLNCWLPVISLALLVLAIAGCGGGSSSPPPAAPTGITAAATDGQATVSWTAVTGATSYNIYYGTTAGVTTSTGTKVANATSPQVVTGLSNGTTYYFVVTAVDGNGESAVSSAATTTPLAIPTGVAAATGDTQTTISWTATTGATSYDIYYSTTSGQETTSNGTKVTNATSPHAITGLLDGTPYYFVVTAVYASGESAPSNEVTTTPITKPSGIVASAENGQATIAWLSVPGATSYNLYYGTTNPVTTSSTKISVTSAAAGTSNGTPYFQQTVTGLTNGTTYYFAVTAVNAGGETALSSQKSAKPSATGTPGSPAAVTVTSTVTGQVHVVWGDYVPDAASYNMYYLQAPSSPAPSTTTVISTGTKVSLATPSPQDLTGFTSGLTYWFVVTAVNGNSIESGGQTNPKSITVQ